MLGFFRRRRPTVEQMLSDLAACGVSLRPGTAPAAMLEAVAGAHASPHPRMDRRAIETGGFEALLVALGSEDYGQDLDRSRTWSDDVWHFDPECIEDDGDYARIFGHMVRLTRGALRFDAVRDRIDLRAGVACLEVTEGGRTARLDLRVRDDWADEALLAYLQSRLAAAGTSSHFAAHDLGQAMLLVCRAPAAIARLNDVTGLSFQALPDSR